MKLAIKMKRPVDYGLHRSFSACRVDYVRVMAQFGRLVQGRAVQLAWLAVIFNLCYSLYGLRSGEEASEVAATRDTLEMAGSGMPGEEAIERSSDPAEDADVEDDAAMAAGQVDPALKLSKMAGGGRRDNREAGAKSSVATEQRMKRFSTGQYNVSQVVVARGDTFPKMLRQTGIDAACSHLISEAISRIYKINRFKPGQVLEISVPKRMATGRSRGSCGGGSGGSVKSVTEELVALVKIDQQQLAVQRLNHRYVARFVRAGSVSSVGSGEVSRSTKSAALGSRGSSTAIGRSNQIKLSNAAGRDNGNLRRSSGIKGSSGRGGGSGNGESVVVRGSYGRSMSFFKVSSEMKVPMVVISQIKQAINRNQRYKSLLDRGGKFVVLYSKNGGPRSRPELLYFSLKSGVVRDKIEVYRYMSGNGAHHFLLKDDSTLFSNSRSITWGRPVLIGAVNSGYGSRWHPIHKRHKMHYGIDYRAPYGAKVVAAADGVVVSQGYNGAFGKAIRMRHDRRYVTMYAHLSGFAPGVHVGRLVKRGDVIGYIGRSGLATGAHLHFELHDNGRRVNPGQVLGSGGSGEGGQQMVAFRRQQSAINSLLSQVN